VWSAVFDHFACYPVISWTFVVLQFFHGLLYFFSCSASFITSAKDGGGSVIPDVYLSVCCQEYRTQKLLANVAEIVREC